MFPGAKAFQIAMITSIPSGIRSQKSQVIGVSRILRTVAHVVLIEELRYGIHFQRNSILEVVNT